MNMSFYTFCTYGFTSFIYNMSWNTDHYLHVDSQMTFCCSLTRCGRLDLLIRLHEQRGRNSIVTPVTPLRTQTNANG